MSCFLIITASIGLLFILKYSYILKVPREWLCRQSHWMEKLFSCSQCLGFWSGFFVALLCKFFDPFGFSACCILLYALAVSFIGQAVDLLMEVLDMKVFEKKNGKEDGSDAR